MFTNEQEIILRQVLRLVDLSGELDCNRSDSDYVENGGTILSVIDENIFEMFARPSHHREAVETFYADIWESSGKTNEEWRSFEAQAALITAEFIISGADSGSDREIFMTDHHRWELAHRIETLISDVRIEVSRKKGG